VPLPIQENSIFVLQSSMCNVHWLKKRLRFFCIAQCVNYTEIIDFIFSR